MTRIFLVVAVIFLLLPLYAIAIPPSPAGGKITFLSVDENFKRSIYLMNADGSDIIKLTEGIIKERVTAFSVFSLSPDCKKAVFQVINGASNTSDITVFDIDSHSLTNLTNGEPENCSEPRWSPDDSKIAFSSYDSANFKDIIYTMNTDGTNIKEIGEGLSPDWSPDGQRIVCWARKNNEEGDIYTMETNGDKIKKITEGQFGSALYSLRWSPDSKQILFCDDKNIYVIDSNGDNLNILLRDANSMSCCWSPDGHKVAFDAVIEPDTQRYIWVMDRDGGNLQRLTNSDSGKKESLIDWKDPALAGLGVNLLPEFAEDAWGRIKTQP